MLYASFASRRWRWQTTTRNRVPEVHIPVMSAGYCAAWLHVERIKPAATSVPLFYRPCKPKAAPLFPSFLNNRSPLLLPPLEAAGSWVEVNNFLFSLPWRPDTKERNIELPAPHFFFRGHVNQRQLPYFRLFFNNRSPLLLPLLEEAGSGVEVTNFQHVADKKDRRLSIKRAHAERAQKRSKPRQKKTQRRKEPPFFS